MLSDAQFLQWCQQLKLSPSAQATIAQIRAAPPARHVRSRAGNVSGRYPSRKMGVTIQFESHRVELAAIYIMEHDPDVLEFYDQPPSIKLHYPAPNGRNLGVMHTPDYFVLRQGRVGWEEWKPEEELVRLTAKNPHRYQRDNDGRWRCPPGEQVAENDGLEYQVRSSAELDPIHLRNLVFLEDYLRADRPVVAAEVRRAIRALVVDAPGLSLLDLFQRAPEIPADEIYTLIATDCLALDLHGAPLADPGRVRIFLDLTLMHHDAVLSPRSLTVRAGADVIWDGRPWLIANAGETRVALLATDGTLIALPLPRFEALVREGMVTGLMERTGVTLSTEARECLARASPTAYAEANNRYQVIAPHLAGEQTLLVGTPARTLRRWLARYRTAERTHGCGYVGLLPHWGDRGNRTRKLLEATVGIMAEVIASDYETLTQRSKFAAYAALVRLGTDRGVVVPSYKTFLQEIHRRSGPEQTARRRGQRAAYRQEPFYWELTSATPRHGDRPFEICHIDHTELDLELVCSQTGSNLGRPWMTFLVDAFSRRLLAFWLTFDPPSYRSCLMVLRACVRRHGRFPQTVVVDGGPEFGSTYFETLLARYACTKKTRPGAEPRFGSVCERLFGTTNTRFIYNLSGNTQITRDVRQVTRAVDPRGQAVWTLGALHDRLSEWAEDVYDTLDHPALGQSPRAAFAAGLVQGGTRSHRLIPYDEDFRMATLPTTPKGTAKVQAGLGVKVRSLWYWTDAFRDPAVEKTAVPVRYDPFDVGTVHVFVQGRWVGCISEHYAAFQGRSEREVMVATAEIRRRQQNHGHRFVMTARRLAEFLASVEAEEVLAVQRRRDQETTRIRASAGGNRPGPEARPGGVEAGTGPAAPRSADAPFSEPETLDTYGEYR
jgi:putative transposase